MPVFSFYLIVKLQQSSFSQEVLERDIVVEEELNKLGLSISQSDEQHVINVWLTEICMNT